MKLAREERLSSYPTTEKWLDHEETFLLTQTSYTEWNYGLESNPEIRGHSLIRYSNLGPKVLTGAEAARPLHNKLNRVHDPRETNEI